MIKNLLLTCGENLATIKNSEYSLNNFTASKWLIVLKSTPLTDISWSASFRPYLNASVSAYTLDTNIFENCCVPPRILKPNF